LTTIPLVVQNKQICPLDFRFSSLAKNTEEFDRSFDKGEDIYDFIDMSKATVIHDFSFEFLRKS